MRVCEDSECKVVFEVCNVLQTCIISTLLVSQSTALVRWSHAELKPGALENLTLDKSFPLPGPQSPLWKKVTRVGMGVLVLLDF